MILKMFAGRSTSSHPLADARELKQALAELPLDNAFKAVDDIYGWLESLRHADDFRIDQYFDVLRQLDDAARPHLRRLARDYLHSPRLSKAEERRLWLANYGYWEEIAILYSYALERVRQNPKDKGSEALKASLPLMATRSLAARVVQLKWVEYRYGPIDSELWLDLGQTYLAAEEAGYAQKAVQLYPRRPNLSSVAQQYLRALVFHASSMDSLRPLEIELADRLITQFLPGFLFSAESGPESVYWIDVAQGQAPTRLVKQPRVLTPTLRFFSPGSAPRALNELIRIVERGEVPQDLHLGGQYQPKVLLPVLRHLAMYWAPKPPLREHQRHAVKTRISVLNGFDDSFTVLAGDVARLGKERNAESWVVENVSLGGFGAGIDDLRSDWLKIGALLCIQPEGGENWVLGIIRRFSKDSEAHANVGIESLSRLARGVEVRPHKSGFSAGAGIPGIWLREGSHPGETRLVLPHASFDQRESLEFTCDGQHYLLTPVELEESGSDYEIARYRERIAD